VDTLLAQCVSSTGWTERPWANPGAPAGGPAASGDENFSEPEIEITEGPGMSGAAPASPEEDDTEAKPEKPDAATDEVIHVELHVELPADEAGKGDELLEPVIPGGTPLVLPESPLVIPEAPLAGPEAPAVEGYEGAPLVTPVKPEEEDASETPLVTPVTPEEDDETQVKPDKLVTTEPQESPEELRDGTVLLPGGGAAPQLGGAAQPPPVKPDPAVKPGKEWEDVEGWGAIVDGHPIMGAKDAEEEDPPVKPSELVKPGSPAVEVEEEEDPPVKPGTLVKPDVDGEDEDPPVKPDKLVNTEDPPEDPSVKTEDALGRPIPVEFPDGSAESTRGASPEEPFRDLDERTPVIPESPLVTPETPLVTPEIPGEALLKPGGPKPQDGEGEPEDEEALAKPEVPFAGDVPNTTDSEEVEEVEMPLRPDAPGSNGSGLPPPLEDIEWDAPGSNGKAPVQVPEMPEDVDEMFVPEVPGNERPPAGGGGSCEDTPGFVDERHQPCAAWAAYTAAKTECHRATEEMGFSQDGEDALIGNCSKSCGLCGESPVAAVANGLVAAEAKPDTEWPLAAAEAESSRPPVWVDPPITFAATTTTPQVTTTPETATTPGAVMPETTTSCDCDDMETVHVKITAVLTPKGSARSGGSLAQRAARRGRRTGSGCDCSGSVPPVHAEVAGLEGSPVAAVKPEEEEGELPDLPKMAMRTTHGGSKPGGSPTPAPTR
jgi:hypothetical protein